MDETTNSPAPTAADTDANPQRSPDLTAEVTKWKALSRTNEARWKDASRELDALRQTQTHQAEEELQAARVEARATAVTEFSGRLAQAELRAQAATAGVELPKADYLNLDAFIGDDGAPDADAIGSFISSLPQPSSDRAFAQNIGLGRQGGTSNPHQLTREEYRGLSRADRAQARKAGRIDALMRGELDPR